MTTIKIVDTETGNEIERAMNSEELAQQVIDQTEVAARKAAETAKATERAALLAKLGITDDEAKLLLS
jgi:hypothetical protein